MNRKIMPFMLFAIEIVMYYFIMNVNMRKIFGTNGKDHK